MPGYQPNEPHVNVTIGRDGSDRVWHDPWDDDVCVTLRQALAAIDDADETVLHRALTERIDSDGLHRVVQPHDDVALGAQRNRLLLDLDGHDITIYADGLIEIDL